MRRPTAVVVALLLAACSAGPSSDPSSSSDAVSTTTPSTTAGPVDEAAWAAIDDALGEVAPVVGLLAAEVRPDGTCAAVHAIEPTTARPIASQFKLFVLGALAEQVGSGAVTWDQPVTVDDRTRSLGNGEGSLQLLEDGASVTVEHAATTMISISDNTAADVLHALVGRDAVEAQADEWMADATADVPFLTTRQMLLLHYADGLGDRYLATPTAERPGFLAAEVDPLPIGAVGSGYSTDPRFIETIEWFASPADVCRALAGLRDQAQRPGLAPLDDILSHEDAGLDLPASTWPTVWYKGGSEPGVLTMGWLATNADGRTYVVEAMLSDPDAPLADESLTDLVDIGREAFALLG